MNAIGIDIGTTSICLGVYEEETGRFAQVRQEKNHFLPDTYQQDPGRIFDTVKRMLDDLLLQDSAPSVIGISSQMHGILYVDRNGREISPFYTWKEEVGNEAYGEETYAAYLSRATGYEMYTGYGSVTHFRLQQTGQIPAEAAWFINIGDYIAMRLCGAREPAMSASIAASMGGFSLRERCFDLEALKAAGVETSFYPEVRAGGLVMGAYRGIPVVCAQGDNQASFYGAIGEREEVLGINVGTGSQVSLFHRRLVSGTGAEIRPFTENGFLYVMASVNGGKVYERLAEFVKNTVYAVTGMEAEVYGKLEEAGMGVPATGLKITPSLYGSRKGPAPGGRVEGLMPENFTLGDVVRAYVTGMALELFRMYEQLPDTLKRGKTEIIASGNGIRKNRLLCQETERIFGLPVSFRAVEEEAAAGAAMWALREFRTQNRKNGGKREYEN